MGNETSKTDDKPSSASYEANDSARIKTQRANTTGPSSRPEHVAEFKELADKLVNINIDEIMDRTVMRGRYVARVIDMHDGDTLDAAYTNEAGKLERVRIRVAGSDTPEMTGCTAKAGQMAKNEALTFMDAEGAHDLADGKPIREWFAKNPVFVELDFESPRIKKGKFDKQPEKFRRTIAHVRVPVRSERSQRFLEKQIKSRGIRPLVINHETTLADYLIYMEMAVAYGGGTKDQSQYEGDDFKKPVSCSIDDQKISYEKKFSKLLQMRGSEGFKGETPVETRFVDEIWKLVLDTKNDKVQDALTMLVISENYEKFNRKKIIRYYRENKGTVSPIDFFTD